MLYQITYNPCLGCGACCAHLRVSFYWSEADPVLGGIVPVELTEKLTPFVRCMQGTNQPNPRCTALDGIVGQSVSCSVYEQRPTPCQEFGIHWENGLLYATPWELERCERARSVFGLPTLATLVNEWQHPMAITDHPDLIPETE